MENNWGICICGLNGSGKTTLGSVLAKKLDFYHVDVENYYFSSDDIAYTSPRDRETVKAEILSDIRTHGHFVLTAVKGDMGAEIVSHYRMVVVLQAPQDIRTERVARRSQERFGARMLPGGDLYEKESRFLRFVAERTEAPIEAWLSTLSCPILRLCGTDPPEQNAAAMIAYMSKTEKPTR